MTRLDPGAWGFVADDLTGACVVGGKLANAGVPSLVATRVPDGVGAAFPDAAELVGTVLGVNADSRVAEPAVAARQVAEALAWVQGFGRRRFFKFVDSVLRGNVGAELEGMLDRLGGGRCLVVPGTPHVGRTVSGGRLFCLGVPAHLSPFVSRDPLSRLDTDRVVDIFGKDSSLRFASVAPSERGARVDGPPPGSDGDRLIRAIDACWGAGVVPITDAEDMSGIAAIVDALVEHRRLATIDLLCGSVGLAEVWARTVAEAAARGGPPGRPPAGFGDDRRSAGVQAPAVLVVSGSRTQLAGVQIARLARAGHPVVEALAMPGSGVRPQARIVEEVASALFTRGAAALVPSSVETEAKAGTGAGGPERAGSFELVAALGRATRAVLDEARSRRVPVALVLVGGMTAGAVMGELRVGFLRPIAERDFVVRSRARSAAFGPLTIVTKGGSAGDPDVLLQAVDDLRATPSTTDPYSC